MGLLIDLAVSEGRPDEVLRWYDQLRVTNKRKRRLVETLDVLLQERG